METHNHCHHPHRYRRLCVHKRHGKDQHPSVGLVLWIETDAAVVQQIHRLKKDHLVVKSFFGLQTRNRSNRAFEDI